MCGRRELNTLKNSQILKELNTLFSQKIKKFRAMHDCHSYKEKGILSLKLYGIDTSNSFVNDNSTTSKP